MSWVKAYARRHRLGIFLFLLFGIIFAMVVFLYQLPMEPAIYAIGLCCAVGGAVLVVDSVRYRK